MRHGTDMSSRGQRGYSLSELLVTLIVLMLVSAIMAAGIPSALRAYMGVVDASNAQILLSTTATRLRDELSMADPTQVTSSDGKVTFVSLETGYRISFTYEDGYLCKIEEPSTVAAGTAPSDPMPLVPQQAASSAKASSKLRATFDSISYDATDGVFTVTNLRVIKADTIGEDGSKPTGKVIGAAEYKDLKIRALAVPLQ